jgi:hypothetical protein
MGEGALADSNVGANGHGSGGKTFFGRNVDVEAETIVLPLYEGRHGDETVWYVVTDSSDKRDARGLGVNYAPKLANALGTKAVELATETDGLVDFPGTVDFAPERQLVPGPTGFPPKTAVPGAVGDDAYSPLYTTGDGIVRNASHVANASGQHDGIVAIDFARREVTMKLVMGFWKGHRLFYLHQDASTPTVAAMTGANLAPNLNATPGLGSDDEKTSARAAMVPIVNGPRGVDNDQRQGLQSVLFGEGAPLNVTEEVPGSSHRYSPMWDVAPAIWTEEAIASGARHRITSTQEVANLFASGKLISKGTAAPNPGLKGLRTANAVFNCPVAFAE